MQDDTLCVFFLINDTEVPVYVGKESTVPASDSNGFLYNSQTSPGFFLESDLGRVLIWRNQGTRFYQSNIVERQSYRWDGIKIWAWISLGDQTDLHVCLGGILSAVTYRDKIFVPYVTSYSDAISDGFIPMDDNVQPHWVRLVDEYVEDQGLERMV